MPPKSGPPSSKTSPEVKATTAAKPGGKVSSSPPLLPQSTAWKTDAAEFRPNWLRTVQGHIRYSPQQMRGMRKAAVAPTMEHLVDHGPFQQIPETLIPYLKLNKFDEFLKLDYDHPDVEDEDAARHTRTQGQRERAHSGRGKSGGHQRHSPGGSNQKSPPGPQPAAAPHGEAGRVSPPNNLNVLGAYATSENALAHENFNPRLEPATDYYCVTCATENTPCVPMKAIIDAVRAREHKSPLSTFLMQSPNVVAHSLLVMQVFDGKRTSIKMRTLKEKCPKVVGLVKSFLCGEGFHIAPPPIVAHDKWTFLLEHLKFDWIRDNRTRIFTELSRNWKRSHSPFEQFMHFYFFRRSEPFHKTKGMLTHKQKPVIVAILSGDVDATVLLCELGFECPSDLLWDRLPYFKENLDPKRYCVLRHLCVHYYRTQVQQKE